MISKNLCFIDDLNFLSTDILEVDRMICSLNPDTPVVIKKAVAHLFSGGGKRIRALLICLLGKVCGCKKDFYIKLAAAIESLHNATLLHDDVIDVSNMRRSQDAVNKIWGNKISILSGDFLLSRALYWIGEIGNNKITKIMADVSASIISGEILQLGVEGDFIKGGESYFNIVTAKTATLFAAACKSVAILSECNKEMCDLLDSFGLSIGVAFQITDDILDYVGKSIMGKEQGKDFLERKITLPAIIAYNDGLEEEKIFWQRCFSANKQQDGDFGEALRLIEKYDVIDKANKIANVYKNKSFSYLNAFSNNPYYRYLLQLLNLMVDRER